MNNVLRRVLVLFLGVIFVMVVLEVGLRVAGVVMNGIYLTKVTVKGEAPEYTILCVGNCYTAGVGAPEGESYPDNLQRILTKKYPDRNYKVINRGLPGRNSSQIMAQLPRDILETDPALVILRAGSANFYNHLGLGEFLEKNIKEGSFLGSLELGGKIFLYKVEGALYRLRSVRLFYLLWMNILEKRDDGSRQRSIGNSEHFSPATAEGALFYRMFLAAKNAEEKGDIPEAVQKYTEALERAPSRFERDRAYAALMEISVSIDEVDANAIIDKYRGREDVVTRQDLLYDWVRFDVDKMVSHIEGYGLPVILQDYPVLFPVDRYEGFKKIEELQGENAPIISVKEDPFFKRVIANPPHRHFIISVNEVLRDYAMTNGIPFVDNEMYFEEEIKKGNMQYVGGSRYPNVFGYRFMAEKVYEKMVEEEYL